MQCVKCDAEMEYLKKSEDNNWKEPYWICPDCDHTETEGTRTDANIK